MVGNTTTIGTVVSDDKETSSEKPFSSVDQFGNPIIIKGLQLRPNGWTPDTIIAVSECADQYVVMWAYNEEDGHWGQGHYFGFGPYDRRDKVTAFADAMCDFSERLTRYVRKEDE